MQQEVISKIKNKEKPSAERQTFEKFDKHILKKMRIRDPFSLQQKVFI